MSNKPILLLTVALPALASAAAPSLQPEQSMYRARWSEGTTYQAANPAQNFGIRFDSQGVSLHQSRAAVTLRLTGYGYGRNIIATTPSTPRTTANGIEYHHRGVTEWYVNGAQGLEQGFTLTQHPGESHGDPLVLALSIDGLQPRLTASGDALLFESPDGSAILRYDGLRCQDAREQTIPAHLELNGRELRLSVDDREAVYPLVVDPTFTQAYKLVAPNNKSADAFGRAVAVSDDTSIAGAPFRTNSGNVQTGSACIFVRNGATWMLQQELFPPDGSYLDEFGSAVAINGDTAFVGSPGNASGNGAVYVYTRSGTTWTLQQKLTASDAVKRGFGHSIGLVGDTAVVTGPGNQQSNTLGAVYVFHRSGQMWAPQQVLTDPDNLTADAFGLSVAFDGSTIVAGAPGKMVGSNANQGEAYVFVRSGGSTSDWVLQQSLISNNGKAADEFGYSVGVSGDNIVVGAPAPFVQDPPYRNGSIYFFVRNISNTGMAWNLESSFGFPGTTTSTGARFGWSVAISGNVFLGGAPRGRVDPQTSDQGALVLFENTSRLPLIAFSLQSLIPSDGRADDFFGESVAFAGNTLLAGASQPNGGSGAAYVFVPGPGLAITKTHSGRFSQGQIGATFDVTVTNSGSTATNAPVSVTDMMPAGLTATALAGSGWNCTLNSLTCTRADSLLPGYFYPPIKVTVNVNADAPKEITNIAKSSVGNVVVPSVSDLVLVNPIQNVTGQVRVTQNGFTRNRGTGLWVATMTVTNISSTQVDGPIQAVLNNLPQGVVMANNNGFRNGAPYITLSNMPLAAGHSVSVSIMFSNPNNVLINFTTEADSGLF